MTVPLTGAMEKLSEAEKRCEHTLVEQTNTLKKMRASEETGRLEKLRLENKIEEYRWFFWQSPGYFSSGGNDCNHEFPVLASWIEIVAIYNNEVMIESILFLFTLPNR